MKFNTKMIIIFIPSIIIFILILDGKNFFEVTKFNNTHMFMNKNKIFHIYNLDFQFYISVLTPIIAVIGTYIYSTNIFEKEKKINKINLQRNMLKELTIINSIYSEALDSGINEIVGVPFTKQEYDLHKWNKEKIKFLNLWNEVFVENKKVENFFNQENVKFLKYDEMFQLEINNLDRNNTSSKINNFMVEKKNIYIFTNKRNLTDENIGIYYDHKNTKQFYMKLKGLDEIKIQLEKYLVGENNRNMKKDKSFPMYKECDIEGVKKFIEEFNINDINHTCVKEIYAYDLYPNIVKTNGEINFIIIFNRKFLLEIKKIYEKLYGEKYD